MNIDVCNLHHDKKRKEGWKIVSLGARSERQPGVHMDQQSANQPASSPTNKTRTWQVSSVRRRQTDKNQRESVKRLDLLGCNLCDERQRSEAGAQEGVSILGHLERSQPVLHGAHHAEVRSSTV